MEIKKYIFRICFKGLKPLCILLFMHLFCSFNAQSQAKQYFIKDGRIHINLSKQIQETDLNNFSKKYSVEYLNLSKFIKQNITDSLIKYGWDVEKNNNEEFIISKPLFGSADIQSSTSFINIGDSSLNHKDNLFVRFGVNNIKKESIVINDSLVTFNLFKFKDAKKVLLAGSFTNWKSRAITMQKTEFGWQAKVVLNEGKHLYKFIIDDEWMLDDNNSIEENDGRGNSNSVFYKPNYRFSLKGFENAKKVLISGSFNNWNEHNLKLKKNNEGVWELPVFLANGTYTYRYIIDGQWQTDPTNKNTFPNEFGESNSVLNVGETSTVIFNKFPNANRVVMTGSFNDWKDYELIMKKTSFGWAFDYAFNEGNFEVKYIVDGVYYNADGIRLNSDDAGSVVITNPNYTFFLKDFHNAKNVFISGDFNNWSKKGFALKKDDNGWKISVHLSKGKHLYKFIVDDKWILDPNNKLWEENEYGTGNSIVWIE